MKTTEIWRDECTLSYDNSEWYFVHIIFCFLYEENIFSCEWLVFWVRSGENSVLKKEKFWITSLRVIPSFSFWNTLFSPRVSQKTSHEQVKIVFFMRQQKIMWTDYFFQFFHNAFQCVAALYPKGHFISWNTFYLKSKFFEDI